MCDSSDDEVSGQKTTDKRRKISDEPNTSQEHHLNFGKGYLKAYCVECGCRGIPSRRSKEHPADVCKSCFENTKHQNEQITEREHEKGFRNRPCKICGKYKISCRIAKEQPSDMCLQCFQESDEYDVRFVKTCKPKSRPGEVVCMLCGKNSQEVKIQPGRRLCSTCKCPEVKVEEDIVAYSAMETLLKLAANEVIPEKTLPWLSESDDGFTPVSTFLDFNVPGSASDQLNGASFDVHAGPNELTTLHVRDIDHSEHHGTLSIWSKKEKRYREVPKVPLDILLMCIHLSAMQGQSGTVGEQIAKIVKFDNKRSDQAILLHKFPDQGRAGTFGIQPIFIEQASAYVKIGDALSITEAHLKELDESVIVDSDFSLDREDTDLKDWLESIEMKKTLQTYLSLKMIALLGNVAVLTFQYIYYARGSLHPCIGTGHTSIDFNDLLKYMETHRYFQFISEEYNKSTKTMINQLSAGQVDKRHLSYLRSTTQYGELLREHD